MREPAGIPRIALCGDDAQRPAGEPLPLPEILSPVPDVFPGTMLLPPTPAIAPEVST